MNYVLGIFLTVVSFAAGVIYMMDQQPPPDPYIQQVGAFYPQVAASVITATNYVNGDSTITEARAAAVVLATTSDAFKQGEAAPLALQPFHARFQIALWSCYNFATAAVNSSVESGIVGLFGAGILSQMRSDCVMAFTDARVAFLEYAADVGDAKLVKYVSR